MSLSYNQTNITNFLLDIPDANITKAFKLNVQSALIPGIRIPPTDVPAGTQGLARSRLPGSTVEFDPLVCRFLVDEDLKSWTDLYQWMLSLNNYVTHHSNGWEEGTLPQFVTLHVLDNTKQNIVLSIHYYGAWCSDLSEIEYMFTDEGDPAVTCVATFQYKYYIIERDGVLIDSRPSIRETATKTGETYTKMSMHPSLRSA